VSNGPWFRREWPAARRAKFRQAAFVYLHVGLLYEAAAIAMHRYELLPERFGPPALYLALGVVITALVFAGLYWAQNEWVARVVWAIQAFRIPSLVSRGFFYNLAIMRLPPVFYIAALIVVLVSMWMLARAGWDL
jgi:protein-S-isoprenylcysteine O-methyltransferase Ste14